MKAASAQRANIDTQMQKCADLRKQYEDACSRLFENQKGLMTDLDEKRSKIQQLDCKIQYCSKNIASYSRLVQENPQPETEDTYISEIAAIDHEID